MLPTHPANSVELIARMPGAAVKTLYIHVPGLKELRGSRVPDQREGASR
ncbi:hypothetical protein [Streptomyces sp. S1D4-20]|nr:hypothetical protein [Streptomyces sp. S1D4-20]